MWVTFTHSQFCSVLFLKNSRRLIMDQRGIILKIDFCALMRLVSEDIWMARTTSLMLVNNALRYLAFPSRPDWTVNIMVRSSCNENFFRVVRYEHRRLELVLIGKKNFPALNTGTTASI